ncbi:SurA N-terminal domain-containing protein [Streptomyces sp. HSW2009]|uniref:SurA N-terminal domain-containing protein n=1 Tax=Streptomyces sp. HSW2009 TaxID=3142890 RepID=UPI0032EF6F8F
MLRFPTSRRTATRRRTALTVSAVALLGATPLLTACGSDAHPGAAAVVDGDRITVSQLQSRIADVRDAQRDSPQSDQLIRASGKLGHEVLLRMIMTKVVERAAADQGISVTRRDVQQETKLARSQTGGAAGLRSAFLREGIAPGQIEDTLRVDLLRLRLIEQLGQDRTLDALRATAADLDIDVNPRYGTWDSQQGMAALKEPWIKESAEDAEGATQQGNRPA